MNNDSDTTATVRITRATAPVDWAPEAWAAVIGETWPDVSAVVQELMARPGFAGEERT